MSQRVRRRSRPYGEWGKHLEILELFEEVRDNPAAAALMGLAESDQQLLEGSGAPEGRVDFPIFLQTVIRNRVRERFAAVSARWREYIGIENAQDFREHTVNSLGAIRGFRGILEHGEYPRLRSSEEIGPSYAVGKYGGIYGVTYELVINDETDQILNRIPSELGRSMAEYLAQTMVALLESNPTYSPDGQPFFSVAHGNLFTGAAAELTEDNIMAILDTMALRRDADNIPINVKATRVIVRKPSQAAIIARMVRSQETGVTSEVTAAGAPTFAPGRYNAIKDLLPPDAPIVEPWLNDPDDWYVLANAQDRPAFVAAFLRNRQEPYIFQGDSGMRGMGGGSTDPYSMDFDEIPFKVRHVFGGAPGEPLAAVKAVP